MTDPKILIACCTFSGKQYALKAWADAVKAQDYDGELSFFQVDNSDGPQTGGNLHPLHLIRGQGIPAVWQSVRFPALWDTLELSWLTIVERAHEVGADFIFSVEADVIIPPDATRKMVDCAYANSDPETGLPAVVTQRYHPRGQRGTFWWDTLGCSLFPVAPLYEDRYLVKAMYETEVFLTTERHGYSRYRPGVHGDDLFIPEHLKDPEDPYGSDYGATPAQDTYRKRVIDYNLAKARAEAGEQPAPKPIAASAAKLEVQKQPAIAQQEHEAPLALGDVDLADDAAVLALQDRDVIRLNLGSDRQQISGFLAVDFRPEVGPDIVADVRDLSLFDDDTVEEIYASHVLEHLSWDEGLAALKEWLRVLKPGAMLTVCVPDINQIYMLHKHGQRWGVYNQPMDDTYVQATAFGAHLLAEKIPEMADQYGNQGHEHRSIYIHDMLLNRVIEAGYVLCHEVAQCFLRPSQVGEVMVQGRKPKQPPEGE